MARGRYFQATCQWAAHPPVRLAGVGPVFSVATSSRWHSGRPFAAPKGGGGRSLLGVVAGVCQECRECDGGGCTPRRRPPAAAGQAFYPSLPAQLSGVTIHGTAYGARVCAYLHYCAAKNGVFMPPPSAFPSSTLPCPFPIWALQVFVEKSSPPKLLPPALLSPIPRRVCPTDSADPKTSIHPITLPHEPVSPRVCP